MLPKVGDVRNHYDGRPRVLTVMTSKTAYSIAVH
jgi:hypothetical protein